MRDNDPNLDPNLKNMGIQNRHSHKYSRGGFMRIPLITLFVWAGIIAVAALLFLAKQRITTPAEPISHAEFLEKFQSNQIARATVIVNQQRLPLVDITGSFYEMGKDGKPTTTEIPFVVHNAWPTTDELNSLNRSRMISNGAPNVVVMNLLWSIAPLLILSAPLWILAIGVLIFLYRQRSLR